MTPSDSTSVAPRRFEFRACLGRGGFGEVYLARMFREGGVHVDVAVKVLATGLDPQGVAVDRLRDEGLLLGLLNHPVVPKVIDLCVLQGRIAMVTEYVQGDDLDKCIAGDDGVPVRALLEVVAAVAEALHAAWHTQGPTGLPMKLVHRDIKPPNIRIGRHGHVKLLDFGVARAWNVERSASTQAFALLGSWSYLAPERIDDPDGSSVRPAADVYALGCVLYEGIAGRRLTGGLGPRDLVELQGTPDGYAHMVRRQLSTLRATCDGDVWHLMERMLAVDPAARPTTDEVARRCEEIAATLPGDTLRRWARERVWPAPSRADGPLVGRVLTEGGLPYRLDALDAPGFDLERTELFPEVFPEDTRAITAGATEDSIASFDDTIDAPDSFLDASEGAGLAPIEAPTRRGPAVVTALEDLLPDDDATDVPVVAPPDEETVDLPAAEEALRLLEDDTALLDAPVLSGFDPSAERPAEPARWSMALWLLVSLPGVALVLGAAMLVIGAGVVVSLGLGPQVPSSTPEPTPIASPTAASTPAGGPDPAVAPEVPQAPSPPAPEPRPGPAPEPARRSAPAPVPAPVPAPRPVPEAAPEPPPERVIVVRPVPAAPSSPDGARPPPAEGPATPATLRVEGPVLVELRTAQGGVHRSGAPLPPGRYQVWANFGRVFIDTGLRPLAEAGGRVTVTCDPVSARCTADPQ